MSRARAEGKGEPRAGGRREHGGRKHDSPASRRTESAQGEPRAEGGGGREQGGRETRGARSRVPFGWLKQLCPGQKMCSGNYFNWWNKYFMNRIVANCRIRNFRALRDGRREDKCALT